MLVTLPFFYACRIVCRIRKSENRKRMMIIQSKHACACDCALAGGWLVDSYEYVQTGEVSGKTSKNE
jgi:hypothetical protein